MAILRKLQFVQTIDGTTVNAARIRFNDDVSGEVTTITCRLQQGFGTRIEAVDPHPDSPVSFLPAIQQAMTDILGVNESVVLANEGVSEIDNVRRYS